METGERLAAYAAGELDADETRALEAELARDPSLRARLAAIRETDELLAGLGDVEPRAGFSDRLRDTVSAEMTAQLGSGPDEAPADELSSRRAERDRSPSTPRWVRLAGAAAAVIAIGGIGSLVVPSLFGSSDEAMDTAGEGTAEMETMAAPEAAAGPTVVSAGRSFGAEDIKDVASDARFDDVLNQRLSTGEGPQVAELHEEALGADGDSGAAGSSADAGIAAESAPVEEDEAAESSAQDQASVAQDLPPDFGLRTVGEISEAELQDVRRCLPQLLEAAPVIPVYAELITFDANDAIVYGLVGNDPEQDSYRRVELWVVGRGDCQVLHFEQVDR